MDSEQGVPFQLSAVRLDGEVLRYAEVNFFSDLPSGGFRRFDLSANGPAIPEEPGVRRTEEGDSIILDNGRLKVRLPASRNVAAGAEAPGPIMQMERAGKWIGSSRLVSPARAVKSITTETVESGQLFMTCRMTYQFEGGGSLSRHGEGRRGL